MLTKLTPTDIAVSDYHDPQEVPGLSQLTSRVRRFHDCLDDAVSRHRSKQDDSLFKVAVLESLAQGCREMGLPMEFATRMAMFQSSLFCEDKTLIDTVFQTAYLRETAKTIPLKYMCHSALLTFKTEAYLQAHYLLRHNVRTGVAEYKIKGVDYGFQPLDKASRNTMTINALKAGVDSWDKDLNRYLDSTLIPQYNPMTDFLGHLPQWDGRDRIAPLAQRVKTDNPLWEHCFHTWLLSMVAQWMGQGRGYGNAIVPLLIGPQGSGKTTFCRRLLPDTLQAYYNDRLPMRNDTDIMTAMSSYALINIDEFDALSKAQQPLLKYLLSKHDVKMRPPYGKVVEQRQRFASFIATTNCLRPLSDPTGSRRFVCAYADEIDNGGRLPYRQLYAQLLHELRSGRRHWLSDSDNRRVMEQNVPFQKLGIENMLQHLYCAPEDTASDAPYVLLTSVAERMARAFPAFTVDVKSYRRIASTLRYLGYDSKRTRQGLAFQLCEV